MSYMCDICGIDIEKEDGYSFTTTQVVLSLGYWRSVIEQYARLGTPLSADDCSPYSHMVTGMAAQDSPWTVCQQCSELVDADADAARQYAIKGRTPPGCGPADVTAAGLEAAYAWSLVFDEWPLFMQVGSNPIIHDESQGARCDFCRRIIYGEEKFAMIDRGAMERQLSRGFRYDRDLPPCHEAHGYEYWRACFNCVRRCRESGEEHATPGTQAKRPWYKFW